MCHTISKNNTSATNQKITWDQMLFLLGVFAKQFYLLPSGSLQVGDVLMLGSFFCYFFIKKRGKICIYKDEYYIIYYFVCIAFINSVYALVYSHTGFLKSTVYYLFNLMILLVFVIYIHGDNSSVFLSGLRKVLQCGLLTQALIYLIGVGEWYSISRYEGTFNDPNQYGVFILLSVLIIYIIGRNFNQKNWHWILLGFLLILPSASSGTLVGYFAFLITAFAVNGCRLQKNKVVLMVLAMILLAAVVIGFTEGYLKMPAFIQDMSMYKRFFGKFENFFDESASGSITEDREWDRVWEYPQYLLYGAGEGKIDRFNATQEIHSSILSPLFCYGVLPFSLFVYWCIRKLKGIDFKYISVYVALFAECFFIVNTRQPMFWMLIALAGILPVKRMRGSIQRSGV